MQIREKEAQMQKLNIQLDDNSSRADSMASHIKNLRLEMVQTQVWSISSTPASLIHN